MSTIDLRFGDSLDMMKDIPSGSVDMILTDIPYGIEFKSHKQNHDTHTGKTIKIDRPEYFQQINNDDKIPPIEWLKEAYRVLKDGTAIYIFVHWQTFGELKDQLVACDFTPKNMIVLDKSNHGMGDLKGQYAPKHELMLFAVKGRHILHFPDKRLNDIWQVPVKYSGAIRLHPNEKPLSWMTPAILCSSNPDDVILDPFMGSGSTGEAALKEGRGFIGIDNDEKYYEIAKKRLEKYEATLPA